MINLDILTLEELIDMHELHKQSEMQKQFVGLLRGKINKMYKSMSEPEKELISEANKIILKNLIVD